MDNEGYKSEYQVIENRTVLIDCPVAGTPAPSIMWIQNGEVLLDWPYEGLRELSNGRQLEVRSVKVKDGGRYTCLATNTAGQLEKTFELDVLGEL